MRIIGCDLHARQQTLAVLDTASGEVMEKTLTHSGSNVQEFYSTLPGPVRVGIEATGSMQWFLSLMEELGIECQVGHPAKIRAAEPRKQKHDRRDADLILKLLVENRFPSIWRPSKELVDLRPCCYTVIHGYGCGRGYRMRCRRWRWRMVYDEAPRYGAKPGSAQSRLCRWRRTPLIGAASCRRCTGSSKSR